MNKILSERALLWDSRANQRRKHNFKPMEMKPRSILTSIPSITQACQRQQTMKRYHEWKQCRKEMLLQQIYDENCRIFVSLQKQKSAYKIEQRRKEGGKAKSIEGGKAKSIPLPRIFTHRYMEDKSAEIPSSSSQKPHYKLKTSLF